jgi:hypothetical protein
MLSQRKTEGLYTISSDQTERDDSLGEIPESIVWRNDDGTLSLGQPIKELVKAEKKAKLEEDRLRLVNYVTEHQGCEIGDITRDLAMSNVTVLKVLPMTPLIRREGKGVKGDPFRYYAEVFECHSKVEGVPTPGMEALAWAERTQGISP